MTARRAKQTSHKVDTGLGAQDSDVQSCCAQLSFFGVVLAVLFNTELQI